MKTLRKTLGIFLALALMVSVPATALAYNLEDGNINVYTQEDGQYVSQWTWEEGPREGVLDPDPIVITGSSDINYVSVDTNGSDANITLSGASGSVLFFNPGEGNITVNVEGTNNFTNDGSVSETYYEEFPYSAMLVTPNYGDYETPGTLTLTGSGTINATAMHQGAIVSGVDVAVNGPSVNGNGSTYGVTIYSYYDESGELLYEGRVTVNSGSFTGTATADHTGWMVEEDQDYYTTGIGVYDANLTVNGGTVVGTANPTGYDNVSSYSILFTEGSTLNLGEGMQVLDANGNDITAVALANPGILADTPVATIQAIPEDSVLTIKNADGKAEVQILGAYFGSAVEKTGEPDAAAMEILSKGIDGECIYKGSFAFTDDLDKHGSFQLNFVLPQYAGQHVIIATIVDGAQVTYDRWVGNDGIACINVDHLGDFAVFLA